LGLLTLSFGVLALWVRSYVWLDQYVYYGYYGERETILDSRKGQLSLSSAAQESNHVERFGSIHFIPMPTQIPARASSDPPSVLAFSYRLVGDMRLVVAPHWFVALVLATLAFALKPKPRLKFSLADLLVLMTFSAALIAGVAGLTRLAS
jgi:hypothetical protein